MKPCFLCGVSVDPSEVCHVNMKPYNVTLKLCQACSFAVALNPRLAVDPFLNNLMRR